MLSVEVPENDVANAKQVIKENKGKMMQPQPDSPEELQRKADVIAEAHQHMADPVLMDKLKPLLDQKTKALTGLAGLAGLKEKAKLAQMREAKKSGK